MNTEDVKNQFADLMCRHIKGLYQWKVNSWSISEIVVIINGEKRFVELGRKLKEVGNVKTESGTIPVFR